LDDLVLIGAVNAGEALNLRSWIRWSVSSH
jgi:hypothetical protein